MRNFLIIAIILYGILTFGKLFTQENSGEKIELLNADVLEGMETSSGNMRIYKGHVRLKHGIIRANSDIAYQYFNDNRAELSGNVVILQNDMTLKAPNVIYEGKTGIATANRKVTIIDSNVTLTANNGVYNTNNYIADFDGNVLIADETVKINSEKAKYNRITLDSYASGNVVVDDDSVLIYSDFLDYHRKTKESKNFGNVVIKGKFNNIYLTGDTIINVPKKNYTIASGKPVLFQIDTINDEGNFRYDTLSISSDTMEAFREDEKERYMFTGNVEIVKGNLFAKANNAVYFRDNELFFLEGHPIVWYDSTQLHGDSIIVYLPDNKLKMINAFGNALAVSQDDTMNLERKNQIVGYSIKIFFTENHIDRIESIGDAKSLYFMSSEKGNDGADRSSCDTIYVYFKEDKPFDIMWLGAVDGEYYPEKLVYNKVKEYFLPNFRWVDNKPGKKKLNHRIKK